MPFQIAEEAFFLLYIFVQSAKSEPLWHSSSPNVGSTENLGCFAFSASPAQSRQSSPLAELRRLL
jgi:hypothetical protein